jgi:glycosidase
VRRDARERYEVADTLFSLHGDLIVTDFRATQQLAQRLNAARSPRERLAVSELLAAGLLHEACHLLVKRYRETQQPHVVRESAAQLERAFGRDALEGVLLAFVETFPALPVYRGELSPRSYLEASTAGEAHREVALEELLLLWLENDNPAMDKLLELVDDTELEHATAYRELLERFEHVLDGLPGFGPQNRSLIELLREPIRHSPTSLEGQLKFIRERWQPLLGDAFERLVGRVLQILDVIKEEHKGGGWGEPELLAITRESLTGGYRGPIEYERFSPDSSWMPRVVLIAKSTYVWLDQLSKRYGQDIHRLDQIPDEELEELSRRGFTGLWLIGLWERSEASRRIKHLRGQTDAVASAYALYDYIIAQELGGTAAYENLRERAWRYGLRLASDMVPNHVGIDGRWVIEHPDWFIQLDHPPYPAYTFNGPDLSPDGRVGIYLEDHYYDGTDAAVVFKRVDRHSGEARYLYHGNDGTSMPWNDTAQLDYLKREVREAVIQTILHVARHFPIIRFDAAMTLAKQHIRRLWYPAPGEGGAIPSRSLYGSMSDEAFEQAIPEEFWREVVDRVAAEVPDTLLLAEAFWMMEGYFVRTLGMHRVYNSAFMNMLKREENAKYRESMKSVLAFDPEILKRFVNFMNNPDEETAVHQFGKGDKYFGVCTLMATLPGLPMFGHGQIEGFTEKYGMEYRRAKWDETPDEALIARHRREIFPLLHRRAQFAEVENFALYDLYTPEGHVDEDVYAYSNRYEGQASLVVYNNRYERAQGWIKESAPYIEKRGDEKRERRRNLAEALGLRAEDEDFVVMREQRSDLEYLRRSRELREQGFYCELNGFEARVYLDVREIQDTQGDLAQLERELQGRGVRSVYEALEELRARPLHQLLGEVLATPEAAEAVRRLHEGMRALEPALLEPPNEKALARLEARWQAADALADLPLPDKKTREALAPHLALTPEDVKLLRAWALIEALGEGALARGRLKGWLERELHGETEAHLVALLHPWQDTPSLAAAWRDDAGAQAFLQVNDYEGTRWFNRERYLWLMQSLVRLAALDVAADSLKAPERKARLQALADEARTLAAAEKEVAYKFDVLLASLARPDAPPATSRATKGTKAKSQPARAKASDETEGTKAEDADKGGRAGKRTKAGKRK